ncbi:Translation machinery-associated protein 46 [Gurleya vavrai]
MAQKKNEKPKSAKDQKKEIEDKMFGMKNKKKNRDLQKQIEKININEKKQKPKEERIALIQPKAPIGTDPKEIMCVYYLNKMCDKGDKCKYGHEKKKIEQIVEKEEEISKNKLVCRFLIDAINDGQLTKNWECPNVNCKDIHKLVEVGDVEISLEEFIELKRQNVVEEDFITEESFKQWKHKKKMEDEEHKRRVKMMKEGITGSELFREKPEMFVDDEEALECDYNERNYSDEKEEL